MGIKSYLLQNMRIKDVLLCVRSITIPKKGNAKECSNYHIIALISHASKVMLKILQARLQSYMNCEIPDVLEKAKEPEIKLPTSNGSSKKQEGSIKTFFFCLIDYAKAFDYVDHNKLWKILKEMGMNTRPPNLPLEKPVCRSGSNS